MGNETMVTEFILLGLSSDPQLQILLFVVFLVVYLITLLGNVSIVVVIRVNPHLHTPMYAFLSCLACLDLAFSSATLPKMLQNLLTERKTISIHSCFAQVFILISISTAEGVLLAGMAYDRYIAICHPLNYAVMMNKQVISIVMGVAILAGLTSASINTSLLTNLKFCGSSVIHHFSCEAPQLLQLSCSDTFTNRVVIFIACMILGTGPMLIILTSYVHIISAVLKVSTAEGKHKAFSTCTSHLTIVILYYGSLFFRYLNPTSQDFEDIEMAPSVMYDFMTPMLNPIIYSLRNQEMKSSLYRILVQKHKK